MVVKAQGAVLDSVDTGTNLCPDTAHRNPKTPNEAPSLAPDLGAGDLIDGGRRSDLDLRSVQDLSVLDLCTSSLMHLRDLSPVIAEFIRKGPVGEPYVAPDMLLAICYHISMNDLSTGEVRELLARPNTDGFPRLDLPRTRRSS